MFSHLVVSNSLQQHGQQHTRFPCLSLSSGACSDSCPLSQWYHTTISSSVIPFFFCLQSFPPSGFLLMDGTSLCIRCPKYWSFSFSIHPSSEYSGLISFMTDWFDLFAVQGTLKSLFQLHSSKKHQFFSAQPYLWFYSHIHTWLLKKIIALTRQTSVVKVISLLFNMQYILVIAFISRSKCLLISSLQSLSAVILELKIIKSVTLSIFPIYLPWNEGTGCHDLHFLNVEF